VRKGGELNRGRRCTLMWVFLQTETHGSKFTANCDSGDKNVLSVERCTCHLKKNTDLFTELHFDSFLLKNIFH